MTKMKRWIVNRVLPVWAKETILAENDVLLRRITALEAELSRKESYIAGLESGIRSQRRIVIYNGEVKK